MKPIFTPAVSESSKSRSTEGQWEEGRVLRIILDHLEPKWVPRDNAGAPRKEIFLDQRLEDRGLLEELGAHEDDLRKVDPVGADFGEDALELIEDWDAVSIGSGTTS
jgi:hypothetical protein